MNTQRSPRVVIIGGGFAGLTFAKSLRKADVEITLLDRQNHHLFQPLLYQVATAALNPSDIASPIRKILRGQSNVEILLADVTSIDPQARKVFVKDGHEHEYDYLVVAAGATHAYFGHDEWSSFAPGLKTIDDALEIRRRVFFAFEAAERDADPSRQSQWLTFAIVGGGPTGVELAGALAEIAHQAIKKDFRRIDPDLSRVLLIEGAPRLLGAFDPALSEKAKKQLETMGVEVMLGRQVTSIDADGVGLGHDRIPTKTVIWAAGVAASPIARSLGAKLDRAGRVEVLPDLSVPGHPEIFVIGDLAAMTCEGKPVPGVAPAAIQEAQHAADNLIRTLQGKPRRPFAYFDKGSMATIGRGSGIAEIGKLKLSGGLAWLAWLFIHILFLIGFRNRMFVLISWAWSYVTYDRGARLITGVVEQTPNTTRVK